MEQAKHVSRQTVTESNNPEILQVVVDIADGGVKHRPPEQAWLHLKWFPAW